MKFFGNEQKSRNLSQKGILELSIAYKNCYLTYGEWIGLIGKGRLGFSADGWRKRTDGDGGITDLQIRRTCYFILPDCLVFSTAYYREKKREDNGCEGRERMHVEKWKGYFGK